MKKDILIYDDLESSVENDMENHDIKHCAELFLNAINDWPTDIKNIRQFVLEVENYFGKPLTREKIGSKKLDTNDNNVWKHEAGSSICDMISVAETYNHGNDFENIVAKILEYYNNKVY